MFVYIDDLLVLSEKPDVIMQGIGKAYRLKEGSVERPTAYLGAQIKEHRLPDNPSKCLWSMTAEKYLKEAIRIVESDLNKLDIGSQVMFQPRSPVGTALNWTSLHYWTMILQTGINH